MLYAVGELQDIFVTPHCSGVESAASGELVDESMSFEDVSYGGPHLLGGGDVADVL